MLRKTRGLAEPVREALAPLQDRIHAAFVHPPFIGSLTPSFGRRELCVLVLATDLSAAEVDAALAVASRRLGRELSVLVLEPRELEKPGWWVGQILAQPRVWVFGEERSLVGRPITCGP